MTTPKRRKQKGTPEDRIRTIPGVAGDEPTPLVRREPLRKCHDYLAAHLVFPFEGLLSSPIGPHRDTRSPVSLFA